MIILFLSFLFVLYAYYPSIWDRYQYVFLFAGVISGYLFLTIVYVVPVLETLLHFILFTVSGKQALVPAGVSEMVTTYPSIPWSLYGEPHKCGSFPVLKNKELFAGVVNKVTFPNPNPAPTIILSDSEKMSVEGMRSHLFHGEKNHLWIATHEVPYGYKGQVLLLPCPIFLLTEGEILDMLSYIEKRSSDGVSPNVVEVFEEKLRLKYKNPKELCAQYVLCYEHVSLSSYRVHTRPISSIQKYYFEFWYQSINYQVSMFYNTMVDVDKSTFNGWVSKLTLPELVTIWKHMMFHSDQIKEFSNEFVACRKGMEVTENVTEDITDYVNHVLESSSRNERKIN
jgi:hypothetical protein